MAIEGITVPTRSRLWNDEDAKKAYELLTGGPVLDDEGNPATDDDGNPVPDREPRAAKFGSYKPEAKNSDTGTDAEKAKAARERAEAKARTQGMALDRVIEAKYGRRFGTSVWVDENGNVIGALVPREPIQRKAKEDGKPAAAAAAKPAAKKTAAKR